MADLFEEGTTPDLSLFKQPVQEKPAIDSAASDKNLAAQGAIIDGTDLVGMFTELSVMPQEERQAALTSLTREAKEQQMVDNANIVGSIVQDPNMTDESKQAFVQALSGIQQAPLNSMDLMAETLHTSSTGTETEEEELHLAQIGSVLNEVMDLQRAKQKAINALAFDEDTGEAVSLTNNLGDLADAMVPFSEQVMAVQLQEKISSGEISTFEQLINFALLGEGKVFMKEAYASSGDVAARKKLVETLVPFIEEAKTLVFTNDNDLLQLDNLMTVIDNEHYGNLERAADDIVSVLDLLGLSPLVSPLVRATKASRVGKMAAQAKASVRRVVSKKQPASPMSVAEQVSPESARGMANMVDKDVTGEAAEALTGTNRSEAMAEVYSPQVTVSDGSVEAKPVALDKHIAAAAFDESSKFYLSPAELENTRIKLMDDISAAGNPVTRPELNTAPVLRDNGTYDIKQTYSDASGGYRDPELALKDTLENLEYYGVKESGLTLMQKQGTEYVPVDLKDVKGKQLAREAIVKKKQKLPPELKKVNMMDDYVVQANFNYSPRAVDIVRDERSVNWNWMDRFKKTAPVAGKTTASKGVLSGAYMLDKHTFQGGVIAVDQGNRLQKVLMDDARKMLFEPLEAIGAGRQHILNQVMTEQNLARRRYTKVELGAMGITDPAELKILDNWKHINDQLWHLTNRDYAKTLRDTGHSFYTDVNTKDKFVGKVVNPNTPIGNRPPKAYDPITKTNELSQSKWDEIVEGGGHIFELKRPDIIDGVEVTHMVVRGGDSSRYVKSIQLDDVMLPYIDGHSHIRYKDSWFIERQLVDENGVPVSKSKTEAILTSPDIKSANKALEKFQKNASVANKGKFWKYTIKADKALDPIAISEKHFEVATNAGLSSQRKRGQTLKSFDSQRSTDLAPNIADPLDSLSQSIAELSRRIPMREYLDDYAARIVDKYGDLLPLDAFNRPTMPKSGEPLRSKGVLTGAEGKRLADLRTNLEHYNMMKYGYHNAIDTGWRNGLNSVGQFAGLASSRLEKMIRVVAEEIPSPTGFFRGMAFNAHIAASAPPSQWLVQGIPAVMNSMLHPDYVFKGGLASDWRDLVLGIIHENKHDDVLKQLVGKKKAAHIKQLKDEWDKTGFAAGIDKHLLVEGGIEQIIETTRFAKTKDMHEAVFGGLRKIGFDKGEAFNLGTFWLATRNDAIKAGNSMSNARHFDEVRAKTRSLTMNMNKAGEMPWNKNSLSLFTQFMISPYKSMTMYLDRGLKAEERVKIAMWQAFMMPLPTALTYGLRARVDVEGAEGEAIAEVISNGLMGGVFNTAVNAMWEDAGSASWQRLVQFDPSVAGPMTFINALFNDTGGMSIATALAQSSPSLSMFEGYNPIAKNLATTAGKFLISPFTADNAEEAVMALEAFAGPNGALWQYTAAGRSFSAGLKELLLQQYEKRYSALTGAVVDPSISTPETFAKMLFGLETTYQTVSRAAKTDMYEESNDAYSDMDILIKEWQRASTDAGFNMDDPERPEYMMRIALEAFPDGVPPKLASYMNSKMFKNKDLMNQVLKTSGMGIEAGERAAQALRHVDEDMQSAYEYFQSTNALKDMREESK